MLKLPFKSSPKPFEKIAVGNDEIGILEITKMGGLSPNETIFIRDNMKNYPDIRTSAVKLAKKIAAASGQKLLDVYSAITSGDTEVLGDYLEEFVEFQDLMERVSSQRRLVMATAIVKFRVLPEWTVENTGSSDLVHPKLVDAIAEFAQKEESGWATVSEPISEEDLGKSPKVEIAA